MNWLAQFLRRLRSSFPSSQADQDLEAELASHLDLAIEENIRRGMTPEAARRQALIRFGGLEQAKQQHREARGLSGLDILWQDLRFTFRALRRDRVFAFVAILILGLGIGANVAVFSVVNTILLRPLPFAAPERLAWLTGNHGEGGLSSVTYQVEAFQDFQRNNQSFQELGAFVPFYSLPDGKITSQAEPTPVSFLFVSGNFFHTLGVQPLLGRLFTPEESVRGGPKSILLSYPFWQHQFGSKPGIVGQTLDVNGESLTIVGVLPQSFDYGAIFAPGTKMDFFRPIFMQDVITWGHMLSVVGRLKPGVTLARAQAESDVLFPQLKGNSHPYWDSDVQTTILGLQEYVSGKLRRSLIMLWCAVGVILLIVCVNLSNLLLARSAARAREFAMRQALGAGRGRLIRQLLTESLVLSGAGAFLGLILALSINSYLAHQGSVALPLLGSVGVDAPALLWTVLIAISAAALFGVAPAVTMASLNLQENLKDGGHGASEGRKHNRVRSALVISEVALACVLLVGAGLLLRSFLRVLDVDLGFQPSHAAVITVDYNDGGNADRRGAILQEMTRRVTAIPGIEAAAVSDNLPLSHNRSWGLMAKGRVVAKGELYGDAFVYIVTPGYLDALGVRLRSGRDFTWQDTSRTEHVIIINEAAARREWPGRDPVGQLALGIGDGESRVIGVMADVPQTAVEEAASPQVLVPVTQAGPNGANLIVRTKLPPDVMARSVMSTLRSLNPGQPATEFHPVQTLVDHSVSPRRFFVLLVSGFATLGLLLASLGIYGVISYAVTQQTKEIGIRMALGASALRVQFGVVAKTLRLVLAGVAAGAIASIAVAKSIASLLFGTAPTDPSAYTAMILLLAAVAFIAGYIPARRASRIDPMVALRDN